MHVKAKTITFLGLMAAISVILIVLSGVFEFNTLFLLAFASYLVGIAIIETGMRMGIGFYIACVLVSWLVAPNKLYCFTYAAFALYIVLEEVLLHLADRISNQKQREIIIMAGKFVAFNLIYLPILIFLPKIVYQGTISLKVGAALVLGGEVVFYLYDRVYAAFLHYYANRLRKLLHLE